MRENLIILVLSIISCIIHSYPLNCESGPEYWCLNQVTAEECGKAQFCEILQLEHLLPSPVTASPPVNVSLYYESLCPGCRFMIQTQIYKTYKALKSTGVVNIQLYPYGNAYEHKDAEGDWVFQCQHGEDECQVNLVETCALHLLPAVDKMDYIHCIESSALRPNVNTGKKCAIKLGLEWEPIFNCFNGSMGNFLEHQMAVATDALKPSHQYVPWITVNGVHTEDIQNKVTEDMLGYVCNVYTGPKPAVCSKLVDGRMALGDKCFKE